MFGTSRLLFGKATHYTVQKQKTQKLKDSKISSVVYVKRLRVNRIHVRLN